MERRTLLRRRNRLYLWKCCRQTGRSAPTGRIPFGSSPRLLARKSHEFLGIVSDPTAPSRKPSVISFGRWAEGDTCPWPAGSHYQTCRSITWSIVPERCRASDRTEDRRWRPITSRRLAAGFSRGPPWVTRAKSGISSRRSIKGGISIGTTLTSKIEIFPEVAFRHFPPDILGRRGDDPHIHLDHFGTANALEDLFLKNANDFTLGFQWHVGNLVQEQGAVVSLLEHADLRALSIVAGWFGAEKLKLHAAGIHRGAVHNDERPRGPVDESGGRRLPFRIRSGR